MKNLIFILIVSTVLFSCASTEVVRLSVLEPAPVGLPSHVRNVGILNRSIIDPRHEAIDVIDKVLSVEGKELDQAGAQAAVEGLKDELHRHTRFSAVTIISDTTVFSNTPGVFPVPLSWEQVETICRKNNMDALFALELFDTDSKISYAAIPVTINTPMGKVPGIEHHAKMVTTVKTGWRIYSLEERQILDEFPDVATMNFSGKGINPVKAAAALLGRKEALMQVAMRSGQNYAARIVPYWLRVSRDYFVRGTDNFRTARRKAQTGNWNDAADLWNNETKNAKDKVAGRACYNMAIIGEINGDVDGAIQWARKSYEDYNNKLALRYLRILENRKINDDILSKQELMSRQ